MMTTYSEIFENQYEEIQHIWQKLRSLAQGTWDLGCFVSMIFNSISFQNAFYNLATSSLAISLLPDTLLMLFTTKIKDVQKAS